MEDIKEKSADEMFEELGYKKILDSDLEAKYEYSETLMGDKILQIIVFAKIGKIVFSYDGYSNNRTVYGLGIKELKAINKKVEELKW